MRRYFELGMVILSMVGMHCGTDPQLFFPANDLFARVSGFVQPMGSAASVVIRDAAMIDSVPADRNDGSFVFDSIPYGSYLLRIHAPGYGTLTRQIRIRDRIEMLGTYALSRFPSQIYSVNPPDSTRIDSVFLATSPHFTDTTAVVVIAFSSRMDTASVMQAMAWDSDLVVKCDWRLGAGTHNLFMSVPIVPFFGRAARTLSIPVSAKTAYGENLEFGFSLTHFPDRSSLRYAAMNAFVVEHEPRSGSLGVDPSSSVLITFRRPLKAGSIERALRISPPAAANVFYQSTELGRQVVEMRFAGPLRTTTGYTVTIDSGVADIDGNIVPCSLGFWFQTAWMGFTRYAPLNGRAGFPVDSPFVFETNFSFDTADFRANFSLTPSAAFLRFRRLDDRSLLVEHSALEPGTAYTIRIDSLLSNSLGNRYGLVLSIAFTTDSVPDRSTDRSLIASTVPGDSLSTLPTDGIISILFGDVMDPISVESRVRISPAVPARFAWTREGSPVRHRLGITPLQPLRAATGYSISLDSGYATMDGLRGGGYEFLVRTAPVELVAYTPYDGQVNVGTGTRIMLQFNTPIDASSILGRLTVLPQVDSLEFVSDAVTDGRKLVIDHPQLLPDTSYVLTIPGTITDLYGVPMNRDYVIRFSTGAR